MSDISRASQRRDDGAVDEIDKEVRRYVWEEVEKRRIVCMSLVQRPSRDRSRSVGTEE
jgi:hypothetical protein